MKLLPIRSATVRVGLVALPLLALQACGSDEESTAESADGDAGGATGSPAPTNAPTSSPPLPCAPCPPPQLPEQLAALGSSLPLADCCIDDATCGVDLDQIVNAASGLLGGGAALPPLGCQDPSLLTSLLGDGGLPAADASVDLVGLLGGGIPVRDGGVILAPDGGGPLFVVDEGCPDITVTAAIINVVLPGCCRPDGTCGASSHELVGGTLPIQIPLTCGTSDEIQAELDSQSPLPGLVTATPTPESSCSYPNAEGSSDAPDASASPDAG